MSQESLGVEPRLHYSADLSERVSSLEAIVSGLHSELSDIKAAMTDGFTEMRQAQHAASKTNWGVIFTGIGLLVVIWAAAIRPIVSDVDRVEKNLSSATSVLMTHNAILSDRGAILARQGEQLEALRRDLERITTFGSPITDRRLSVLEMKAGVK